MDHLPDDEIHASIFAINARVIWTENDQKHEGVVVAHVKPGELPSFRRFPLLFKRVCEDGPRLRDSCVVVVGEQAHWPEPDQLMLAEAVAKEVARIKVLPPALPDRRAAGKPVAIARPELPPGSDSRTKMLLSSETWLKSAFYPVWPHTTEAFGPIFVGHFDGEATTANVVPADEHGPIRLEFIRDADGKMIARGFLSINRKGTVGVEVLFRNRKRAVLTTTHAAAAMLPRAMGVAHEAKNTKPQHPARAPKTAPIAQVTFA